MPRPKSKSTDSLWSALGDALRDYKLRRPTGPGWKTKAQLVKELGCGKGKLDRIVRDLVASKKLEVFSGCEKGASGIPARQVWYRPKR
jgi:hypothetical protein